MEDFDYIDALAKSELSGRTVTPSKDGWETVQHLLKRKKKKRRLLIFLLFFVFIGSFGIYQGINFNSGNNSEDTSIVNKNIEQSNTNSSSDSTPTLISDSDSTSISNSDSDSSSTSTSTSQNNTSQAGTNTTVSNDETLRNNNHQTGNSLKGSQNGIANTEAKIKSSLHDKKHDNTTTIDATSKNDSQHNTSESSIIEEDIEISAEAATLKLYAWELITPEKLKKKRKKQTPKKQPDFSENLDVMVGLNGFFSPNEYVILQSYVVEVSYTEEKKLKNDYYFNYGTALQFRNLRYKNDSISFNRGELSLNIQSSLEKRFGNYGVEAGAYIGYEFYSPNNEIFNNSNTNFFEQKINYGLATSLNYKKIGLVFKYELSPYIDYLGNKKYGGFIIGVKYDF